jgi:hypothetical protein
MVKPNIYKCTTEEQYKERCSQQQIPKMEAGPQTGHDSEGARVSVGHVMTP